MQLRLGTPISSAPGSPRIAIPWVQRRAADHRYSLDGRGVWRGRDTCTCVAASRPGHLGLPEHLSSAMLIGYDVRSLSRVRLFETPRTVAYEAPPSMGFSKQAYWNGLLFPSPGDLPDSAMEPRSPALGKRFTV